MNVPRASEPDLSGRVTLPWLFIRLLWVAVQLVLFYAFAQQGDLFFYQGF